MGKQNRKWAEYLLFKNSPITPHPSSGIEKEVELYNHIKNHIPKKPVALLLSAGYDSSCLSYFLAEGSTCYTISVEGYDVDEWESAKLFVPNGCSHTRVMVNWNSMKSVHDELMVNRGCALYQVEPAVYLACLQAKKDGYDTIIFGQGADIHFDDWKAFFRYTTVNEVVKHVNRISINPNKVLKDNTVDVYDYLGNYIEQHTNYVDSKRFCREIVFANDRYGFINPAEKSGLTWIMPYIHIHDINHRVGKPMIKSLFNKLYPNLKRSTKKIGFSLPYKKWLKNYQPTNNNFLDNLDMSQFNGKEKFRLYSLEKWMEASSDV